MFVAKQHRFVVAVIGGFVVVSGAFGCQKLLQSYTYTTYLFFDILISMEYDINL